MLAAIGYIGYRNLPSNRSEAVAFEKPGEAAATPAAPHPYAKLIELTGIRLTEDAKKKTQVHLVAVNHSAAETAETTVEGKLVAGGKSVASFSLRVPALGPYESKEVSGAAQTQLRAYEMPDWQFLKAEFQFVNR